MLGDGGSLDWALAGDRGRRAQVVRQNGWPAGSAKTRNVLPAAVQPGRAQLQRPRLAGVEVVDQDVEVRLLRAGRVRPPRRGVVADLLEHHALAAAGDQRALGTVVGDLHAQQVGVEAGQRRRVRRVDRHREQLHHRADAVLLAQVERVAGRVGQRDPGRAVGQPGGAQVDGPLGRGLVAVDLQVEVELLRPLLARPLRRDVVGRQLEGDLLAVAGPDGDPVGVCRTISQPASSA